MSDDRVGVHEREEAPTHLFGGQGEGACPYPYADGFCGLPEVDHLVVAPSGELGALIREIIAEAAGDDWEPYDSWGDYVGYGESGDAVYVEAVDQSNSGDVHAHGRAYGAWEIAKRLRVAIGTYDDPTVANAPDSARTEETPESTEAGR